VEVDAKILLAQFKEIYCREVNDFLEGLLPSAGGSSGGIRLTHDEQITEKLLNLETPDLDEFMVFRWLTQIKNQNHFDIILLDPAPAGHLLRFFELPGIAKNWIRALLTVINKHNAMEKTQETVRELLDLMKAITIFEAEIKKAEESALVAVATPQEVVLDGMLEMVDQLKHYGIRLDSVIVNMIRADHPSCILCHQLHLNQALKVDSISKYLSKQNFVQITQANREILGKPSLTLLGEELYG
jgi:arsenite-transporting ATPase